METTITLGASVKDRETGIDGVLIARTEWFDRSTEVAILRHGVNHDGLPWDVFWFPESRLVKL